MRSAPLAGTNRLVVSAGQTLPEAGVKALLRYAPSRRSPVVFLYRWLYHASGLTSFVQNARAEKVCGRVCLAGALQKVKQHELDGFF